MPQQSWGLDFLDRERSHTLEPIEQITSELASRWSCPIRVYLCSRVLERLAKVQGAVTAPNQMSGGLKWLSFYRSAFCWRSP